MTDTYRIRELEKQIQTLEGQLKDAWAELHIARMQCIHPSQATAEQCSRCKNLGFAFDGGRMCYLSKRAI